MTRSELTGEVHEPAGRLDAIIEVERGDRPPERSEALAEAGGDGALARGDRPHHDDECRHVVQPVRSGPRSLQRPGLAFGALGSIY